jgi:alkaline phosphatase
MRIPLAFVAAVVLAAGAARALPTQVTVTPPAGARFLAGQRFDLRVEGRGTPPYSATLAIDGVPQPFTSGALNGAQTDGISAPGWGGFNLRGYSTDEGGLHTLTATFSDSTGTVQVTSGFQVVGVTGRREGKGEGSSKPVKNIIIMLGDGMGTAHRTAARLVKFGATGGQPDGFLAMDAFPGTGLVTTHSLNSIITDSAPGMACYSTGSHANNGQEGVYPAHVTNAFYNPRVEYMAEYLHRVKGASLGLVTTADVEDATPAANAVHTGNRNAGQGIVDQYLDEAANSGLAVLLGGGRRWFLPSTQFGTSRSTSNDYAQMPADLLAGWSLPPAAAGAIDKDRDLLGDFTRAGFRYVDSAGALNAELSSGTPDKLLGLFAYGNMNVALDKLAKRRGPLLPGTTTFAVDDYHAPDQPMLDEMTEAALRVLSKNRRGFVLMVEAAHIDKQSHAMDADRVIDETIELDNAVGVARRWADELGDTVVIVLADHECAGFSIIGALSGGISALKSLPSDSTAVDPLQQPARQRAVGTFDAAGFPRYQILADGYPATFDVDGKILVGYGGDADRYEDWQTKPTPVIDSLLPTGFRSELAAKGYGAEPVVRQPESTRGFFIRGQAAGRGQAVHTASDIPVSAYSSGSRVDQQFTGVQTNTDIFFKLMRAALTASADRD